VIFSFASGLRPSTRIERSVHTRLTIVITKINRAGHANLLPFAWSNHFSREGLSLSLGMINML
jgi:hypothetical protein